MDVSYQAKPLPVAFHKGHPGKILTNIISGFFNFLECISAKFLAMKHPHMHSDLGLLMPFTCTLDKKF